MYSLCQNYLQLPAIYNTLKLHLKNDFHFATLEKFTLKNFEDSSIYLEVTTRTPCLVLTRNSDAIYFVSFIYLHMNLLYLLH